MAPYKIWPLRLVLPFRFGRLLTGVLLFALLYRTFSFGSVSDPSESGPALFFSAILAYIIPVFSFITEKVKEALVELRPILGLDNDAFEQALTKLDSASWLTIALHILFGIVLGFAHLSLIEGSLANLISETFSSLPDFLTVIGALTVWVVMTTVTSMLVKQTVLFARLGKNQAMVSLLNTRKLLPFSRVAVISSLSIIGALALFPLLAIESGLHLSQMLPGAIATLAPLLAIFVIPVWPIHRRLAILKEQELDVLDNKIASQYDESGSVDIDKLQNIAPLLNYRQEISRVSTWPFDGGAMTRLIFYLIIPPLTWAGAALIEQLIDSSL